MPLLFLDSAPFLSDLLVRSSGRVPLMEHPACFHQLGGAGLEILGALIERRGPFLEQAACFHQLGGAGFQILGALIQRRGPFLEQAACFHQLGGAGFQILGARHPAPRSAHGAGGVFPPARRCGIPDPGRS